MPDYVLEYFQYFDSQKKKPENPIKIPFYGDAKCLIAKSLQYLKNKSRFKQFCQFQ